MPTYDREWAEPFRSQLQGYAAQLLGRRFPGKLEIADLVQKTLWEASQQAPPAEHPTAKLAWLKAALRNNFQDEMRRLTAKKRTIRREVPLASKDLPAKEASPSHRLKQSEAMHELLKHVEILPAEQQQAVRLRFIEELSIEAVAQRMRKTRAATNGLIRRGLNALRENLDSSPH